jgi:hypothetical protein
VGKGKSKAKAQVTSWQIKAFSIRKLDRKDTAPASPAAAAAQAQPDEDAPFSCHRAKALRASARRAFLLFALPPMGAPTAPCHTRQGAQTRKLTL